MNQIKKRVISTLLTLCMIFLISSGLVAEKASALRFNGATVYIESAQDFTAFAKAVCNGTDFESVSVKLECDITLTSDFPMVGEYGAFSNSYFSGTFDGQGHTITGNIASADNFVGLFACIYDATLRNFTYNGNVDADNDTSVQDNATGGICAYALGNNTIDNVTHIGNVEGYGKYRDSSCGGILGYSDCDGSVYELTTISNCRQGSGLVRDKGNNDAGGIAGQAKRVINCTNDATVHACRNAGGIVAGAYTSESSELMYVYNCTNNGNVTSDNNYAGGIAANSMRLIENCVNNGTISGFETVGGILARRVKEGSSTATNTSFEILGCTNNGRVESRKKDGDYRNSSVGGIFGGDTAASFTNASRISACTNNGAVIGDYIIGGIAGHAAYIDIENCASTGALYIQPDSEEQCRIGGIMGDRIMITTNGGSIKSCYFSGTIEIRNNAYSNGLIGRYYVTEFTVSNCYQNVYYSSSPPPAAYKSKEDFASGEVCWLLNSQQSSNPVFYQILGRDATPTLGGGGVVERVGSSTYQNKGVGNIESSPENGSVAISVNGQTINPATAVRTGTIVTITATPINGYKIKEWQQQTASSASAPVSFTLSEDKLTATFTMPYGNVKLVPIFSEITHNVRFEILGSGFEISSQDVAHNSDIQIPDMEAFFEKFNMSAVFNTFLLNGNAIEAEEIKNANFNTDTVIQASVTAAATTINFFNSGGASLADIEEYASQTSEEIAYWKIPAVPRNLAKKTLGWSIGKGGDILTPETITQLKGKRVVDLYATYADTFDVTFVLPKDQFTPALDKDVIYDTQTISDYSELYLENLELWLMDNYGIFAEWEGWKNAKGVSYESDAWDMEPDDMEAAFGIFYCKAINVHFYDADGLEMDEGSYPSQTVTSIKQLVLPPAPYDEGHKGCIGGWSLSENGEIATYDDLLTYCRDYLFDGEVNLYVAYEPIDFTSADIKFVNESGTEYTTALNAGDSVKAQLATGAASGSFKPTLILVLYSGNRLVGIASSNESQTSAEGFIETPSISATKDNLTVKAFVWNSLSDLLPLCEGASMGQ